MSENNRTKSVDILNNMTSVCSNCKSTIKGAGNFKKHKQSCLKRYVECENINCKNKFHKRKESHNFCCQDCFISSFRRGEYEVANRLVTYRTLCFEFHQHKCVVCEESEILDVHHFDGNRENNIPENLVPMCPTHHRYIHHKDFKEEYDNIVLEYLKNWEKEQSIKMSKKNLECLTDINPEEIKFINTDNGEEI